MRRVKLTTALSERILGQETPYFTHPVLEQHASWKRPPTLPVPPAVPKANLLPQKRRSHPHQVEWPHEKAAGEILDTVTASAHASTAIHARDHTMKLEYALSRLALQNGEDQ